ncbi:family 2 glycosyl transferase [Natrialba chahannaoensis JCM 10990]|uniref:Family 2 glycosyl transferase n=1 Tax=Natrialba chahannaoensis JCM 10990 TaxID=1227492 RepID=M0ABP9_9EURY|nr:glycosyltransferase family 2 protein [Natrialba chahannaoensis]ELY95292.1 family 2 glycosyl transferase [Natrialba chahannaoensis JCM 10990]
MYNGHSIGVVVTSYNEEPFVGEVIETVPSYVDRIYAVDDASPDGSWAEIQRVAERLNAHAERDTETESDGESGSGSKSGPEPDTESGSQSESESEPTHAVADGGDNRRVVPIRHEENCGYGGAVKTGYERAAADGIDVVAVMNGDGQMDPTILDRIIDPVVAGEADYAKGNRLLYRDDREGMSTFRFVGNAILSGLSKFSSGYWTISDPQNGYTAISRETIEELDLDAITDQYGFLNHILTHLNVNDCRVADVSMSAIYGDEESSIRYVPFIRYVSLLLLGSFYWRLKRQYVIERFHPAALFYGTGTAGIAIGSSGLAGSIAQAARGRGGFTGALASILTVLVGLVSIGIAIAMDAEENEALQCTWYEDSAGREQTRSEAAAQPAQSETTESGSGSGSESVAVAGGDDVADETETTETDTDAVDTPERDIDSSSESEPEADLEQPAEPSPARSFE